MIPQPPDYQGPKTFYDFLVKLEGASNNWLPFRAV
jgi:hypothetical protein